MTDTTEAFANQTYATPAAGFVDMQLNGSLYTTNGAFAIYDLTTPIGPIGGGAVGQGTFAINLGELIIADARNGTYTASLPYAAVLEPASLDLFGSGVVGLALFTLRRRKGR